MNIFAKPRVALPAAPPDFEEAYYLAANPDVAVAVRDGVFESGLDHWRKHGKAERRPLFPRPDARFGKTDFDLLAFYKNIPEVADRREDSPLRVFIRALGWPVARLFNRAAPETKHIRPRQEFASDLKQGEAGGEWASLSRDPKWFISLPLTAGYFRIEFAAQIKDAMSPLECGKWQIYFDYGKGFTEIDSINHYFRGDTIACDYMVRLPRRLRALRIDPVDFECSFAVKTFEISHWPFIDGLLVRMRRHWRQLARKGMFAAMLRDAAFSLVTGRPGRAIDFLTSRNPLSATDPYQNWIRLRRVDEPIRAKFKQAARAFTYSPTISILMPAYRSELVYLCAAIDSVRAQTYEHWELCIVDDGSQQLALTRTLSEYAERDARIKFKTFPVNSGIAAASNVALAMASGDFIALLDHDDALAPHALHAIVHALQTQRDADWLYSDEDKIDEAGRRSGPLFKPIWAPAFMLACMYTCHLGVYRRELALSLGGFRSQFDMAQDYDLALRFARATDKIVHVPDVLYHWRTLPQSTASGPDAKPKAVAASRRAVLDFVERSEFGGDVLPGPFEGTHRPRFKIKGNPLVSIVIPTAGRQTHRGTRYFVEDLVDSIRTQTKYANLEIVVVENNDFDPALRRRLDTFNVRHEIYTADVFNFSEKLNFGVRHAAGKYVVLLNDDTRVVTPDWIESMLSWCQQPDVAAVGAKLLFSDETIQHAGVVLLHQGPGLAPSHILYGCPRDEPGLAGCGRMAREYSAVTAACLMVRAADYLAVGGFDPFFRLYNDIDFCLRLRASTKGRIICDPYAVLYHYESASLGEMPTGELEEQLRNFNAKWKNSLGSDLFYNIQLSQWATAWQVNPAVLTLEQQYGLP